jgi:hypothetical protein
MHIDEARVIDFQRMFDRAERSDDREALDALIADDFMSIGPTGRIINKAEWIARHRGFVYHPLETDALDVRVYGPTAIVRTVQHSLAQFAEGDVPATARVSEVWVRQGDLDHWKLASIQFSPLAPQGADLKLAQAR